MSKKLRNRKRMKAIRWYRHYENRPGLAVSFTLYDWMVFRDMQKNRNRRNA